MGNQKQARPIKTLSPAKLATFHGILWIVLPMMLAWKIVPVFEKIFVDFETDMPAMTVVAIDLSHCVVNYFYLMLPLIAVFCTADLIVLNALDRHPKAAVLRWLWLALMLLVPLGLMAVTMLAMFLPLISLVEFVDDPIAASIIVANFRKRRYTTGEENPHAKLEIALAGTTVRDGRHAGVAFGDRPGPFCRGWEGSPAGRTGFG